MKTTHASSQRETEEESDNGTIVTTHSSITVRRSNVTPGPGMQELVMASVRVSPETFLAASNDNQRQIVDYHISALLLLHSSQQFPEMTAERRHTIADEVVGELIMQERVMALIMKSPETFLAASRENQRVIVDFQISIILSEDGPQQFPEMTAERRHRIADEVVHKLIQERVMRQIMRSPETFLAASRDDQRVIVNFEISAILSEYGPQQFPEMTAERHHRIADKVVDELRAARNNPEAPMNNPAVGPPDDVLAEDSSGNSLSTTITGDADGSNERSRKNGASNAGSRDTSTLQGEGIGTPTENDSLVYSADGANDSPTLSTTSNVESASAGHGSGTSRNEDESTSYRQQDEFGPD